MTYKSQITAGALALALSIIAIAFPAHAQPLNINEPTADSKGNGGTGTANSNEGTASVSINDGSSAISRLFSGRIKAPNVPLRTDEPLDRNNPRHPCHILQEIKDKGLS